MKHQLEVGIWSDLRRFPYLKTKDFKTEDDKDKEKYVENSLYWKKEMKLVYQIPS